VISYGGWLLNKLEVLQQLGRTIAAAQAAAEQAAVHSRIEQLYDSASL
jgi:hypothetical protein